MRLINSTKKCNGPMNSSKNKLYSKKKKKTSFLSQCQTQPKLAPNVASASAH